MVKGTRERKQTNKTKTKIDGKNGIYAKTKTKDGKGNSKQITIT